MIWCRCRPWSWPLVFWYRLVHTFNFKVTLHWCHPLGLGTDWCTPPSCALIPCSLALACLPACLLACLLGWFPLTLLWWASPLARGLPHWCSLSTSRLLCHRNFLLTRHSALASSYTRNLRARRDILGISIENAVEFFRFLTLPLYVNST